MVNDLFSSLLLELGQILEIQDLTPDSNNSSLLKLKNGVKIQIEPGKSEQFLIMGAQIGNIPPGRYRDNIFREALKANNVPPKNGIFAYSKKSDQLILFQMIPLEDLTGTKIHDYLVPFSEKVKLWQEAISRGEIPSIGLTTSRSKGLFGL